MESGKANKNKFVWIETFCISKTWNFY